ncbi:MAG: hypothetical protein D6744_03680, partial [Planctomycetota bacterium]
MHIRNRFGLAGLLAFLTAAAPLAAAQAPPEHVALTGARVIPISGPPIDGATILITRGKIAAIGEDVEVPFDARVFDVSDKVVMPGLVLAHTSRGTDRANETRPVTPQLDVYDSIDPSQLFFEDTLRGGVTAVHVMPGNNTVIGGLGRVVRPIGLDLDEMTIAEGAFLKIAVGPRRGYDPMTQRAELRAAFLKHADALAKLAERRYEEQREEDEKPLDVLPDEARKRGVKLIRAEDLDDENRNLLRLTGGFVKVGDEAGDPILPPLGAFVYCERAMDVGFAVQFAKDHGFFDRLVLVLGGECYKAIDELKAAARPVVLPPDLLYRESDPITGEVSETFVAKVFADAGLHFALVPGPDTSLPERLLTYQAARCVRNGVPRDVALRAITAWPAEMLGLGDRLGTLEVGKAAHLTV